MATRAFRVFLGFPELLGIQASADFLVSVVFLAFQASQVSAGIQGFQAIQAQAYRGRVGSLVHQAFLVRQAFLGYQDLAAQAGGYRDWETDRKSTRLNSSH